MADAGGRICLAIDTASDVAGVALLEDGGLLGEASWRTRQSHSRQLLPALDWLLHQVERDKDAIGSIAVCLGPGSYAGMRVGLSTAKTLAFGLDVPLVGVGRLAADALAIAESSRARVVPVQAAGRAELAYACYRAGEDGLAELIAPRLGSAQALIDCLGPGDIVCGEIERLDEGTRQAIAGMGCRLEVSRAPRAVSLGVLGLRRLANGERDDPDALVPLYLRAPAIGPQPPR